MGWDDETTPANICVMDWMNTYRSAIASEQHIRVLQAQAAEQAEQITALQKQVASLEKVVYQIANYHE